MSRISSWKLALLWLAVAMTVASVSADSSAAENLEDVELITASRSGDEYVAISGAEGDTKVSASPPDLKKNSRKYGLTTRYTLYFTFFINEIKIKIKKNKKNEF